MADSSKPATYHDIPGWFHWDDRALFDVLLRSQEGRPGVLVELGCYMGKSSVIIADHRHAGERFVVVDLFGSEAEIPDTTEGGANLQENRSLYKPLTLTKFESYYKAFHDELPEIVQGLSTEIMKHVEPGSVRFLHVDASHMYAQVAEDITNARKLLVPDGIVVLDDFRTEHTPGVSGAVWEAVIRDGMIPFALTRSKMYAVWGDPQPYLDVLREEIGRDPRLGYEEQDVLGHRLIRARVPQTPPPPEPPKLTDDELDAIAARVTRLIRPAITSEIKRSVARHSSKSKRPQTPARALAKDLLPPAVHRWVRARRRAWR